MKRVSIACILIAGLVLPAAALAGPGSTDRKNAAKECRAERAAMGVDNFRDKYGANKNKRNASGKCVSRTTREERAERRAARRNAAKECKAERLADPAAFREKYGTNKKKSNAFGKCVSQIAKQLKDEADDADKQERNAAKECKAERRADPGAFRQKYGTNRKKRNAFGKCVSAKVKEDGDGGASA